MSIIRLKQIEKYINDKNQTTTKELAEYFNVSVQTVRSDLAALEQMGVIKRYHGGATTIKTIESFDVRISKNQEEKEKIADYAASIINNNDTIFLDGGSTMLYIIEKVPINIKINIVTASVAIAEAATRLSNSEIYLLGGILNKETKEIYGPTTVEEVKKMSFDKAFIGVSGISLSTELTENNLLSMDMKKNVLNNSLEKLVLADSSKFGEKGLFKAFSFDEIDVIVTAGEYKDEKAYSDREIKIINKNGR